MPNQGRPSSTLRTLTTLQTFVPTYCNIFTFCMPFPCYSNPVDLMVLASKWLLSSFWMSHSDVHIYKFIYQNVFNLTLDSLTLMEVNSMQALVWLEFIGLHRLLNNILLYKHFPLTSCH